MSRPNQEVPAIVVGVSPSTGSKAALLWAAREAELRRAPLHAVMAWRPPRVPSAPGTRPSPGLIGDQNPLEEALESLEQAVASALGNSDGVQLSAIKGTPEKALLAATEAAQLLVLGTSHPGRVSGAISTGSGPRPWLTRSAARSCSSRPTPARSSCKISSLPGTGSGQAPRSGALDRPGAPPRTGAARPLIPVDDADRPVRFQLD
ncbi:MAG TPA: universal stress protein, partial [Candidatus Dormibacteraeota bacterium]